MRAKAHYRSAADSGTIARSAKLAGDSGLWQNISRPIKAAKNIARLNKPQKLTLARFTELVAICATDLEHCWRSRRQLGLP